MKLKDRIREDIEDLSAEDLAAVYSCVRALKHKHERQTGGVPSIEEVREALSTSESNWAEAVSEDREERV
jgi:hypothetical protein